ncbi:MAG: 60S ribosomal protein L28, partial [Candidatus Hodarchaeales archaeon]
DKGHCAFKTSSTSPAKTRCNHLFTVTGEHKFTDCPLVQPKYFAFQQQESLVYLIEKSPSKSPAAMWGFTELPDDREKARKKVEKIIKDLNKELVQAILRKFEQQFDMADLIKESEKLKEEDETFDSDTD